MKKLLICDLDGTLIDSREDLATGVNLMREHYNLEKLSVDTVTSYIGNGAKSLAERALKGTDVDIDEALPIMKMHYKENMFNKTYLYDGVTEGLATLFENDCDLAIITNKPEKPAQAIAEHLKIDKYFKYIIGGDSNFALKPDPEAIYYVMKETECTAENCWIIGDNYTDLESGKHAGVKRCFADYGFGFLKGETYDLKVDSFQQMVDTLLCQ